MKRRSDAGPEAGLERAARTPMLSCGSVAWRDPGSVGFGRRARLESDQCARSSMASDRSFMNGNGTSVGADAWPSDQNTLSYEYPYIMHEQEHRHLG